MALLIEQADGIWEYHCGGDACRVVRMVEMAVVEYGAERAMIANPYQPEFALLGLLRTALANEEWAPTQDVSWRAVHELAVRGSVEGLAWCGIERMRAAAGAEDALAGDGVVPLPKDLERTWASEADAVMWRRVQFDVERERIVDLLAAEGIVTLPVKGAVIAPLYPDPRMRSMCDNDILFGFVDPAPDGGFCLRGRTALGRGMGLRRASLAVRRVMLDLGYESASFLEWNNDSYTKAPVFNFEMHRGLVPANSPLASYYANPWARACNVGDRLRFRMKAEDEYLYCVAHAFNHEREGGCGVRYILDVAMLLCSGGKSFDWCYVFNELTVMGIGDFERAMRSAAFRAFGTPDAAESFAFAGGSEKPRSPEEDEQFLLTALRAGVHGTADARFSDMDARVCGVVRGNSGVRCEGDRKTGPLSRIRYIWRRVAMEPEGRMSVSPLLGSSRLLLPGFLFVRMAKAVRRLPVTVRELHALRGK